MTKAIPSLGGALAAVAAALQRAAMLAPIVGALPMCVHAAPEFDAQFAVTADDNIGRAARDSDIRDDRFASLNVGVNFKQPLSTHYRLIMRGFAQGEEYDDYSGLSNIGAGVSAQLQYRHTGTLLAPTFALFVKAATFNYDSSLRDSEIYQGGASVQKGITDRITVTSIAAGVTRASDSRVFDTRELSLLLNLDYRAFKFLTPYLTYNYLDGDIVASGAPWLKIINYAEEIQADDAFAGANMYAYRLNARTHVTTLGFNFALNDRHAVDFSQRVARSQADGDIKYDRSIFGLAYLLRF